MLTAEEHYSESERLLRESSEAGISEADRTRLVATAQVHAILALAADALAERPAGGRRGPWHGDAPE